MMPFKAKRDAKGCTVTTKAMVSCKTLLRPAPVFKCKSGHACKCERVLHGPEAQRARRAAGRWRG